MAWNDRDRRRSGGGGRFGAGPLAQTRPKERHGGDYHDETGGDQTDGQPAPNACAAPPAWSRSAVDRMKVGRCRRNGRIQGPQSRAQTLIEVIHRSCSQLQVAGDRALATTSSKSSLGRRPAPRRLLPGYSRRGRSAEERLSRRAPVRRLPARDRGRCSSPRRHRSRAAEGSPTFGDGASRRWRA